MCKSFEIAKNTVDNFIAEEKPFGFEEVQDEIIKNKGVLRVAAGVTISNYLDEIEEKDIIFFNTYTQKYNFVSALNKDQEKRLEKLKI